MERNPLNIPEILDVVSKHLWRQDRVCCLRVSRLFYSVMMPAVWRRILLQPSHSPLPFYQQTASNIFLQQQLPMPSFPTGEALERNKHHIQELEFHGEYPSEYFSLEGCIRLHTLKFSSWILAENMPAQRVAQILSPAVIGLAKLVAVHCMNIREVSLSLTRDPLLTVTPALWDALIQCTRLEQLSLKNLMVPNECTSFFMACGNVASLYMNSVKTPDVPDRVTDITERLGMIDMDGANDHHDTSKFTLPGPRMITIVGQPYLRPITSTTYHTDPKMVRACSNLESITWRQHADVGIDIDMSTDWDDTSTVFCNDLSISPWPLSRLATLDLSWTMVRDEALAQVLSQMLQLKTLKAIRTGFGPYSLHQLLAERWTRTQERTDRLCDSIETLILDMCTNVTGAMIQTILSNCCNLLVFSADEISIQDIAKGEEWICTKLKDLRLYLAANVYDTNDDDSLSLVEFFRMQRTAFARLGQLTRLTTLNLTFSRRSMRAPMKTLCLRIEAGLELMSDLKDLREVSFQGDGSQMLRVEEASWIVENWPQFRMLRGSVNEDIHVLERMKSVFYPQQISFHIFC